MITVCRILEYLPSEVHRHEAMMMMIDDDDDDDEASELVQHNYKL